MDIFSSNTSITLLTMTGLVGLVWAVYYMGRRRYLSTQCIFCDGAMRDLMTAMQEIEQGVVLVDLSKEGFPVVYANAAFLRISGRQPKQIIGQPFDFLKGPETDANVLSQFAIQDTVMPEKKSADVICYHEDGTIFWARIVQKPVLGKNYLAYLLQNIEDEKSQQWQTFQAQKLEALGMLSGGIAHDFNNVLSIIEGNAAMLEKRLSHSDDEKITQYIKAILDTSDRGAALTRQLLAFGRQKIALDETCDLVEMVQQKEVLFRPLLGENIKMAHHLPDEPVIVKADKDVLWQVMMNLVSNARDSIEEKGLVEISSGVVNPKYRPDILKNDKNRHEFAYLTVADTGSGIPDHIRNRIFEPFFTTKEMGKGTGLGLSVVYGLVKQMQGYIDIETAIEQGTRVTIYLPLAKNKTRVSVSERPRSSDKDFYLLESKTILIVDDEMHLADIIGEMAEGWGMKVLKAYDADEALAIENDHSGSIDFMLTDISMPDMDGIRLGQLFKEVRPHTHILYMTGNIHRNIYDTHALQDMHILHKPVRASCLKEGLIISYNNYKPNGYSVNLNKNIKSDTKSLNGRRYQ